MAKDISDQSDAESPASGHAADPTGSPPDARTPATVFPSDVPAPHADDVTSPDAPAVTPPAGAPLPGPRRTHLGRYDLLSEIARGGMGIVYRACDRKLNRIVALKVTQSGQLASGDRVKRFQAEAEAAAKLDHPNIVPIYEVGEEDGQQFISMAFVEGRSLAERVAVGPLPPREAATLIRQVAAAVAYAHSQGVIHRDLKPANIMLDGGGQPRVTDFGLAKRTDADSSLTQAGQIMGTPGYMSPEQAKGQNEQVGPLADVYSVGATLYRLVAGRPPFQSASVMETLRQVVEREPVAPRSLNPAVDRDLDTIILKCLQKRPEKRYASARALAEDLQRYLDRRPILARPVGALEKGVRWCRRNPLAAASLAGVVGVFLAAFALVSWSYFRAEGARHVAEQREQAERWERYRANLIAAGSAMQLHNVGAARSALDAAPEEHRNWEWHYFRHQLDTARHVVRFGNDVLAIAVSPGGTIAVLKHGTHVYGVAFSPDGTRLASACANNLIRFWDMTTHQLVAELDGHTAYVHQITFSPDGTRLVSGSGDLTVRVWDSLSVQERAQSKKAAGGP